MPEKLPLRLHSIDALHGVAEVGVYTLTGYMRLENFAEIPQSCLRPGETLEEAANAYIGLLQTCSDAFFESRARVLAEPTEVKVEVPVTVKWKERPNCEGIWLELLLDEGVVDSTHAHHVYQTLYFGEKIWVVGHHQRPRGILGMHFPEPLEKFLARDLNGRTRVWQLLTTDTFGKMEEVQDRNGLSIEGISHACLFDLEWMLYGDLQTCSPELVPIVTENLTSVRTEMARRNLKREPSVETEYARSEESRKENGFEEFNPWEYKGDVVPTQTPVMESEWPE